MMLYDEFDSGTGFPGASPVTVDDVAGMVHDPIFAAESYPNQAKALEDAIPQAHETWMQSPEAKADPQAAYQKFSDFANEARQIVNQRENPVAAGARWARDTGLGALKSIGTGIVGGAMDLTPVDDTGARIPLSTVSQVAAEQAGKLAGGAATITQNLRDNKPLQSVDKELQGIKDDLYTGAFLHDPQKWLAEKALNLSQAQEKYYKHADKLSDDSEAKAFALSNGLQSPRNAALVEQYIKTRNPAVLHQLRKQILQTPSNLRATAEQNRVIGQSVAAQTLDLVQPGLGEEAMKSAGDPVNLAAMLLPYLKAAKLGPAAKVAKGAAWKRFAKSTAETQAMAQAGLMAEDPTATLDEHVKAAAGMLLVSSGMHALGRARARLSGKNTDEIRGQDHFDVNLSPEISSESAPSPASNPADATGAPQPVPTPTGAAGSTPAAGSQPPPTPQQIVNRQHPDYADAQATYDSKHPVNPVIIERFGLNRSKELPSGTTPTTPNAAPSTPPARPTGEPGTSISHADTDAIRAAAGLPAHVPEDAMSRTEASPAADRLLAADPNITAKVIERKLAHPEERIDEIDAELIRREMEKRDRDHNDKLNKLLQTPVADPAREQRKADVDAAQDAVDEITQVTGAAGTAWSKEGKARRRAWKERQESLPFIVSDLEARTGQKLTEKELAKLKQLTDQRKAAREASEQAQEKAETNRASIQPDESARVKQMLQQSAKPRMSAKEKRLAVRNALAKAIGLTGKEAEAPRTVKPKPQKPGSGRPVRPKTELTETEKQDIQDERAARDMADESDLVKAVEAQLPTAARHTVSVPSNWAELPEWDWVRHYIGEGGKIDRQFRDYLKLSNERQSARGPLEEGVSTDETQETGHRAQAIIDLLQQRDAAWQQAYQKALTDIRNERAALQVSASAEDKPYTPPTPEQEANGHTFMDASGVLLIADILRTMARQARDVYHFGRMLVQRFGEWIKPHLAEIWSRIRAGGTALIQYLHGVAFPKEVRDALDNPNTRGSGYTTGGSPDAPPERAAFYYADSALENGTASYADWKSRMEQNGFRNTDEATFRAAAQMHTDLMKQFNGPDTPADVKAKWQGEQPDTLHSVAQELAKAHALADESLTGQDPSHVPTLVGRVQADLKDLGHDLTPSETARAITNYGPQPEPQLSPAQRRINELRAQMLANEKLADAQQGKLPWIKRIFTKQSDEVRRKNAEIADAVRKIEDEEVKAGRMKSAQHKREANLENQIKDIDKAIEDEKAGRPTQTTERAPVPDSKRSVELKARRDALQAHLDDLRKDRVQAARRAKYQARLDELSTMLENGERYEKQTARPEADAEVQRIKDEIATITALMRAEDKALEPTPSEAEIYNKRKIAAAKASEAHYKELLEQKKFNKSVPSSHPLNLAAQAAVDAAKKAKKAFQAGREASGIPAGERLADALASKMARIHELTQFLMNGTRKEPNGTTQRYDKSHPAYLAAAGELKRLQKIVRNQRIQRARNMREAADAYQRGRDEAIADLERVVGEARRRGKPAPLQEAELSRLKNERAWLDAPEVARQKKLADKRLEKYTDRTSEVKRTGQVPVKKSRRQVELDESAYNAQVAASRAKYKLEAAIEDAKLKALPYYAQIMRLPAYVQRVLVLLSAKIFVKLGYTAARTKPVMTMLNGVIGRSLLKVFMRDIASQAPSEGGHLNYRESTAAFSVGWARGLVQAKNALLTGMTDNMANYGEHDRPEAVKWDHYLVKHSHTAMKAPIWEAFFELSTQNRIRHAGYESADAVPPHKLDQIKRAAAVDAYRNIYMNRNAITDWWQRSIKAGESSDSLFINALAEAFKVQDPIVKVPTNLPLEAYRFIAGVPHALIKRAIIKAKQDGKITPEQADSIALHFREGATFYALVALALLVPGAIRVGGTYVKGEKRKPGDLQPDEVEILDTKLAPTSTHAGIFLAANAVATGIRQMDPTGQAGIARKAYNFLTQTGWTLAEQIPMARGAGEFMVNIGAGKEKADARSRSSRSWIPPPVQRFAEQPDYHGPHSLLYRLTWDGDMKNVTYRGQSFQSAIPKIPLPLLNQLPSRLDLPVKQHR